MIYIVETIPLYSSCLASFASLLVWRVSSVRIDSGTAVSLESAFFYGARKVSGLDVVSKVQLYVDLFNSPARGEEATEALSRDLNKEWAQQRDR
ncbi:MAG: type IV toxin-antitoxin system AbiEi family antitoxin [Candidatus Bathyarchaeia archaeon]